MGGFLGLNIVYTYAASGEVTQLPIDVAWACTNLWSGFGILLGPFFSGLMRLFLVDMALFTPFPLSTILRNSNNNDVRWRGGVTVRHLACDQ